jgi:hypothetical protein
MGMTDAERKQAAAEKANIVRIMYAMLMDEWGYDIVYDDAWIGAAQYSQGCARCKKDIADERAVLIHAPLTVTHIGMEPQKRWVHVHCVRRPPDELQVAL